MVEFKFEHDVCSQKETGRCWNGFMNEWMNEKWTVVQVKCKTEFVLTLKQARGLWGCLGNWFACAMDGQVGVESTWVCGPVRAEAGDWHTAHAARGLNADDLTVVLTLVHLLGNEEGDNNVTCWEYTRRCLCGAPQLEADSGLWKHHNQGTTWWKRICPFVWLLLIFRLLSFVDVLCRRSCATSGLFVMSWES